MSLSSGYRLTPMVSAGRDSHPRQVMIQFSLSYSLLRTTFETARSVGFFMLHSPEQGVRFISWPILVIHQHLLLSFATVLMMWNAVALKASGTGPARCALIRLLSPEQTEINDLSLAVQTSRFAGTPWSSVPIAQLDFIKRMDDDLSAITVTEKLHLALNVGMAFLSRKRVHTVISGAAPCFEVRTAHTNKSGRHTRYKWFWLVEDRFRNPRPLHHGA